MVVITRRTRKHYREVLLTKKVNKGNFVVLWSSTRDSRWTLLPKKKHHLNVVFFCFIYNKTKYLLTAHACPSYVGTSNVSTAINMSFIYFIFYTDENRLKIIV